jgi:steroid delta-isomerase-like uncharacterized protein
MSVEENVALMRRWFEEIWNQGRLETVTELLAPNAIGMGQGEHDRIVHGPDDFLPFAQRLRQAFPDIHVTVEDAFGSGDKVVVRWSATMTHLGNQLGIPASGKRVNITGMTLVRFSGGQIAEGWDNWDQLRMMQMIGALHVPTAKLMAAG